MSGPAKLPYWPSIARALAASGCDLTEYGESLAASIPDVATCGFCGTEYDTRTFLGCPLCASRQAQVDRVSP